MCSTVSRAAAIRPEQARDSLGTYGRTKAAGEEAVEAVLGGSGQGVILRTSWVIGPAGKNLTMLRLPHQHRQGYRRCCTGAMREQRVGTTWP